MTASTLPFWASRHGQALHTELSCTGLRSTPVALLDADGEIVDHDSDDVPYGLMVVGDLTVSEVLDHHLRPCRVCALELVLDRAMNEGPVDRFVTFTAQPAAPYKGDGNSPATKWANEVSNTGRDRLRRIAARAGASTTTATCGPIATMRTTELGARLLTANLRTFVPSDPATAASPAQAAAFWAAVDSRGAGEAPPDPDTLFSLVLRVST
ncbi:MAG: hypothetical protein GY901_09780 [Actinomycetia bacterium]|nr:hypothetical protein [Actinomycetes bacterium]